MSWERPLLVKCCGICIILCLIAFTHVVIASQTHLNEDAVTEVTRDVGPADSIVVGQSAWISASRRHNMHGEVVLDANPVNPKELIACSISSASTAHPDSDLSEFDVVYASDDSGRTWHHSLDSPAFASDPSCGFSGDGRAFFIATTLRHLLAYRSVDGLAAWREIAALPPLDAPVFTRVNGEPHCLLIEGTGPAGSPRGMVIGRDIYILADDGTRFGDFGSHADPPGFSSTSGNAVTDAAGNLWVVYRDLRIKNGMIRDNSAGKSNTVLRVFELPTRQRGVGKVETVANAYSSDSLATKDAPSLSVDASPSSPFFGSVYVVWSDVRTGRNRILFSSSHNRGDAWSRPTLLDDNNGFKAPLAGPDDFMPTITVGKSGVIGVVWYDRRDAPDDLGYQLRFTASLDGGLSWLPSVPVTSYVSDWNNVPLSTDALSIKVGTGIVQPELDFHSFAVHTGDYSLISVDARGVFHPIWVDTRTGTSQLWTAPVAVHGAVTVVHRRTSEALVLPAQRQVPVSRNDPAFFATPFKVTREVTQSVRVVSNSLHYNSTSHRLTFLAAVQNLSMEPLTGPLALVIRSAIPRFAAFAFMNADNRLPRMGACWSFDNRTLVQSAQTPYRLIAMNLLWRGPQRLTHKIAYSPYGWKAIRPYLESFNFSVISTSSPITKTSSTTRSDVCSPAIRPSGCTRDSTCR